MRRKLFPLLVADLMSLVVACGDDGADPAGGGGDGGSRSRPTVMVTTSILGDVVANLVGDRATVEVLMPPGASPHDFELSARQAAAMREADALVVNGAGFEVGLVDATRAARADGAAAYEAIDAVDQLRAPEGEVDPHFFTDPQRMATAARGIVDFLDGRLATPAGGELADESAAYLARLDALDAEVAATLAPLPEARRRLVTNHEVFGYFADRYRFEVVGAVIPGGGTQAAPSPSQLDDLAATIRATGVPAVFADTSSPQRLAEALAAEVGDSGQGVEVVELYSESLGPPGSPGATYLDLVRTNAERIAAALADGPQAQAAAR